MEIDIINCISECMEKTNFFNNQKKLDAMHYLIKGETYREIAEKIDKQISYVQRVMHFLRDNGLFYWGRWAPNVYKIGMKKSIAILDWKDKKIPKEKNKKYTTYARHVMGGKPKVFVVYTYPKEDEQKIEGERGELATPFYSTYTRFTTPLFKKVDLKKDFFDTYGSMDNDKNILSGTPNFKPEKIYTDPITVCICRYGELLPQLTPGIVTDKLEEDFKEKGIDVNYEQVRQKLISMKEEEVIFPKNALYLEPLSYQSALVRINIKEIYKVVATFNKFNMLTELALTKNPQMYYLYIQFPFYQISGVMEILAKLDPECDVYIETEGVISDTFYYQWSLERSKR